MIFLIFIIFGECVVVMMYFFLFFDFCMRIVFKWWICNGCIFWVILLKMMVWLNGWIINVVIINVENVFLEICWIILWVFLFRICNGMLLLRFSLKVRFWLFIILWNKVRVLLICFWGKFLSRFIIIRFLIFWYFSVF